MALFFCTTHTHSIPSSEKGWAFLLVKIGILVVALGLLQSCVSLKAHKKALKQEYNIGVAAGKALRSAELAYPKERPEDALLRQKRREQAEALNQAQRGQGK